MTPDLVLFLGAGASAPPPSAMPTFGPLTEQALECLGWEWKKETGRWEREPYPDISPPWTGGPAPEVVFRALDEFEVDFAGPLAKRFCEVEANAAHRIAAALLRRGGSVWTTNLDMGVENAFGGAVPTAGVPRRNFDRAGPGVLVKLHGSAEDPASMAFTDKQLVTPLPDEVVERLASLVKGKHLLFYGYQGADPDLAPLLDEAMRRAGRVTWLVAEGQQRQNVERVFRGADIHFRPEVGENDKAYAECARELLGVVPPELLTEVDNDAARQLQGKAPPAEVPFAFRGESVPQIVHARVVKRFGLPADHHEAMRQAFRDDVRKPGRAGAKVFRRYLVEAGSASLYDGWLVAGIIRVSVVLSRYPPVRFLANLPVARRFRDFVLDKGPALLLRQGRWQELRGLTEHGANVRRRGDGEGVAHPADRYYLGHALRYAAEIDQARDAQAEAERGLEGRSAWPVVDPERLAGAILEQGILDLYQGRFDDADLRAWDLMERRGRFAIRRWRAWGQWLAGTAAVFRHDLTSAASYLDAARTYFDGVGEHGHAADVRSAQLLLVRVGLAMGDPQATPRDVDDRVLTPRQHDDLALVSADLALAEDRVDDAARLANRVLHDAATPVAYLWARLVRSEAERRRGNAAPDDVQRLGADAARRGATWLELQVVEALGRRGADVAAARDRLAAGMQLPSSYGQLQGRPVLWSLT